MPRIKLGSATLSTLTPYIISQALELRFFIDISSERVKIFFKKNFNVRAIRNNAKEILPVLLGGGGDGSLVTAGSTHGTIQCQGINLGLL